MTLLLLLSALAAPPPPPPPPADPPKVRIHFLNVGQGAATLVEFPCGAMLVDTGGEENESFHSSEALKSYLDAFFARRTDLNSTLDLLLVTHPHIDHMRGLPMLSSTYKLRNVVDNGQAAREPEEAVEIMRGFEQFLEVQKLPHQSVSIDDLPPGGGGLQSAVIDPFPSCKGVDPRISVLWGRVPADPGWGDDSGGKPEFIDENNHSVVTRIDFGETSVLITGDLEVPAIRSLLSSRSKEVLDADIYEVGHHGSHNGTTAELLAAVTPDWAVMEVGPADRKHSWTAWAYGHPRQVTVALLDQGVVRKAPPREVQVGTSTRTFTPMTVGHAIYATGWDGSIVLEGDAKGTIVRGTPDIVGM